MRSLRSRVLPLLLLATASACAAVDETPGAIVDDNDEAALGSYEELMAGAPANATLPDDNKADAIYPATFDVKADQSRVQSQGSRGVCSIFSAVGLMESLYIKAGQPSPDFSEQYLQWSVKFQVGAYTMTSGSNSRENLQAISQYGIVEELAWPYETQPWGAANDPECVGEENTRPTKCHTNGTPPQTALDAPKFKLPAGKYLNTNSIKAHLTTKKTGVLVGMDFFYQAWNHRGSTIPVNAEYWRKGYVTAPNAKDVTESHTHRAGHSILIIGWDDNLEVQSRDGDGNLMVDAAGNPVMEKGFYIFKNSWGTSGFGVENPYGPGYGYLSMKYVRDQGSAYVSDVPVIAPPVPPTPAGVEHHEAAPTAAIPDNSTAGITSVISVPAGAAIAELVVNVDITHTYIGDLTVRLRHGDKTVALHAQTGGADDNLVKAYTLSDWNGTTRGGDWTLEIVDGYAQDTGTLNRWSLDLR